MKNVPQELKCVKQWVLWKLIHRDAGPTKLPYRDNGEMAKSNDSSTWCGFLDAWDAYQSGEYTGIGFVFSEHDPYCGIDLDGCRNPETGEISPWAREIIVAMGSYAEVSPSQTGVKIWIKGKWNHAGHKVEIEGQDELAEIPKTPAIEVYDRLRYFAVTGQRLQGMDTIQERQAELDALHAKYWPDAPAATAGPAPDFRSLPAVCERARKYLAKVPVSVSGQNGHGAAFHAACVLVLGFGLDTGEAFQLLSEWNAGCQPPWSEKELRHKIDSASRQGGERNYLRNVEAKNFDRVPVPTYKAPPPKPEPRMTTLREAADKYLESIRGGKTRFIETGIPELDYALSGGVELGEMFLMAGRPSHGKSAVALQMVHHWTHQGLPSMFISEEMSAVLLGKRTLQFVASMPEEYWSTSADQMADDIDRHFFDRAPCHIVEGCRTAEAAADAIRLAAANHGVKCVVVDYAQLLQSPGKSRYEQVTNTSVALRQVATETGVLLVALAQLNRQIESRTKFTPQMSDLKDTGQLEQDADVVVFGVWPHRCDPELPREDYQFFIAKNRNRGINANVINCKFSGAKQQFTEDKESKAARYDRSYFGSPVGGTTEYTA